MRDELASDALELGPHLWAEVLADTRRVPRPQYLDYVRRQWLGDPAFAAAFLERLAPRGPHGLRPERGLRLYVATITAAFRNGGASPIDTADVAASAALDADAQLTAPRSGALAAAVENATPPAAPPPSIVAGSPTP